jgi:outer membrane scaffolding protein for murein synthesis (MipA/OmpV family)
MSSHQAFAQDTSQDTSTDWIITIGGSTEYGPSYQGASRGSFNFVPSFDIRRLGEVADYSAPDDNIDFTLFDIAGVEFGPVAGFRTGRSTSDDRRLNGLQTVDWTIDAGAFAQYWPIEKNLRLRVETRQALWGGDGLVADLAADWFVPVDDKLVLSVGGRASIANTTYMSRNFGITSSEAATNGQLDAFDANGGLKSVGVAVAATYALSPAWSAQIYYKYDRLMNDAATSPVTSVLGSPDQNTIGFSLTRSFQISF